MFKYDFSLNTGAKRSDVPYGHASMLLLGAGSEATELYNKYDKIRPHSIRSLLFDQKVRPLSFRAEKFDLFTATHIFQPVALEVHGSLGESSEIFIMRVCKILKQRISMALQIGIAACVLGTVSDRDAFEEIYYIVFF